MLVINNASSLLGYSHGEHGELIHRGHSTNLQRLKKRIHRKYHIKVSNLSQYDTGLSMDGLKYGIFNNYIEQSHVQLWSRVPKTV